MSVATSWKTEPLSQMVDFIGGGTPSRAEPSFWGGTIPWATVKDFKSTSLTRTGESITEEGLRSSASRIIKRGTLIMPTRMALGKVAVAEIDVAINQDLKALSPRRPINSRFLLHALLARRPQIEARGNGATVKGITIDDLGALSLHYPADEAEQRRIAAILDKADAIRARRRAALADADALACATFLHLFGDLVTNPMEWETGSLGELIADGPQNGLYRPASDYGSGTPILRINSFQRGRTSDLTQLKRLRIDAATRERWRLNPDDIIINRVNSPEHLGKSALIPQLTESTVFESNMMRFSVDTIRADPRFLIDQLQTAYIRRQIARRAKPAVNQSSINQEDVRSFEVRLPPLPRQRAYARFVTELEVSRTRHCTGLADADALYASLAARAFRGEL